MKTESKLSGVGSGRRAVLTVVADVTQSAVPETADGPVKGEVVCGLEAEGQPPRELAEQGIKRDQDWWRDGGALKDWTGLELSGSRARGSP